MTHFNAKDSLESMFVESHAPEEPDALWHEVSTDQDTRDLFNTLANTSRALEDTQGPSSMERAFSEAVFLSNLDAALAKESLTEAPANNVVPLFGRLKPLVLVGLAAAAIGVVSTQITQDAAQPTAPQDEFQPRSLAHENPSNKAPRPEILAYCVETSEEGDVRFTGAEEAPFRIVSCPNNAELKLAYRQPERSGTYVAVFGVDAKDNLHWYGPSPAAPQPVIAHITKDPSPLGESILLSVNHKPGPVRVHAVFSNEPLEYDRLKKWVFTLQQQGISLFEQRTLPSENGAVTTSTTFEVKEVSP